MTTVALKGMKFYAYHGYYEFERKIGNNFTVDVTIKTELTAHPKEQIESTVNYEWIYQVVKKHMSCKYRLLETLAYDMVLDIKKLDPKILQVQLRLVKHNPPVGGTVDEAEVTIEL